jgi:hypothetical protein
MEDPARKKMKLESVRVGFIGAGDISTLHAAALKKMDGVVFLFGDVGSFMQFISIENV